MTDRRVKWLRPEEVNFGVPPAREPKPSLDVRALRGKRVVLNSPLGFVYDHRAWSESYTVKDQRYVDVVTERDWYTSQETGQEPKIARWRGHLVWVE